MSIVIAYADTKGVYIAGDRIVIRGDEVSYACKVVRMGSWILGLVGCRDLYCNLLRCPPPEYLPQEHEEDFGKFVNTSLYQWAKGDALKGQRAGAVMGYLPPGGVPELIEIDIAEEGKGFYMERLERLDPGVSIYTAIGSGGSFGLGAFEALLNIEGLSTEERLDRAIRTTCKCHLSARPDPSGRIDVLSMTY